MKKLQHTKVPLKQLQPLKYLARSDKWYLGGGNRLIWAPPFPQWLDEPGFWDTAHYYNIGIQPVFTWTILDEEGNEIPLKALHRRWEPASLVTHFRQAGGNDEGTRPLLPVSEVKCALPNDILASVVRIENRSRRSRRLSLIAWTAQASSPGGGHSWLADVQHRRGRFQFTQHVRTPHRPEFSFSCTFGLDRPARSFDIVASEGSVTRPFWSHTPFAETIGGAGLTNRTLDTGAPPEGIVFMGVEVPLELRPKGHKHIIIQFGAAPTAGEASSNFSFAGKQADPVAVSEMNWNDHFASVPNFLSTDEWFTRYYWYRWYGLRLNTLHGDERNYVHPAVCEGIGYFRAPISYSAPCHMLENRWQHDPSLAQGSMRMFAEHQREDGCFRGYIDVDYLREEMMYHANWGPALLAVNELHPSTGFLEEAYGALTKYARYFDKTRDEEVSGLYDIRNHYETGQEYMHRYIAVAPRADQENWGDVFRLKGVDATVYVYEIKRALAVAARAIGKQDEAELWELEARKIREAVLARMWDPEEEMFFDVDPASGRRTGIKAATCFYPYMTDIVGEEHCDGFRRHLLDPEQFWTKFPVPSSSADDEYFSADATWKGKRMNCPWNGRVWPMTNSHIAEALAASALRWRSAGFRELTVEFITKFVRMMFHDGDAARPNCFEHYNPMTGTPSVYRGIDDYQHSWVNDLILKYVAGVRPAAGRLVVDPFEFDLSFDLDDVIVRGHHLRVQREGSGFRVWLDKKFLARSTVGVPVVVELP